MEKPPYFDSIQQKVENRWRNLEDDPDLYGPWMQLFQQIQSPRHVISELLQNADDVGAKQVSIHLQDNTFLFKHDGRDFDKENFHSLCGFGFSNKRTLHTIGFRGIGFKSTFSLGPSVEVYTPTLSVAFEKERFTLPIWKDQQTYAEDGLTTIRVAIPDDKVKQFLESHVQEWYVNPIPLLFFNNIEKITLNNQVATRKVLSIGPVENSQWVELNTEKKQSLLIIETDEMELPSEALDEVRMARGAVDFTPSPCRLQLILGLEKQQLFIILPAGVSPELAFSINAPFLADPARTGIKDPISSPLNRWLLEQAATLASQSFLRWIDNDSLSERERANAYGLLPLKTEFGRSTIAEDCADRISKVILEGIRDKPILLCTGGKLVKPEEGLDIPDELSSVWTEPQLVKLFGRSGQSVLSKEINEKKRDALAKLGLLERIKPSDVLDQLNLDDLQPPKPSISGVKTLWYFVSKYLPNWDQYCRKKNLKIVPVKGKKKLYPASEVKIPSAKEKKLTDAELQFLDAYLTLLDPEFQKAIQKIQEYLDEQGEKASKPAAGLVNLFKELGLNQGITIESLFNIACEKIFAQSDPGDNGIRMAHIASRLGIEVPSSFRYLCGDNHWRKTDWGILLPGQPYLELLLDEETLPRHQIHKIYEDGLIKEDLHAWRNWLASGHSHLRRFLLPEEKTWSEYGKEKLAIFCRERGGNIPESYPYKSLWFRYADFLFPANLQEYWEELSQNEQEIWANLVEQIAKDWENGWGRVQSARIYQETNRYYHDLKHGHLDPQWVIFLKSKPCVLDTNGKSRFPAELLRHTEHTAALERIEPFLHPRLDKPDYWPLLNLLGVRHEEANPEKILERLQAVAQQPVEGMLLVEVVNLYDVLDRLVLRLPSDKIAELCQVFRDKTLILSESGSWHTTSDVYRSNPEGLPGVTCIHSSSVHLNLWEKIGVSARPALETILNWLAGLEKGSTLPRTELKRVRAILQNFPDKAWQEANCWLNLAGEVCHTSDLEWGTSQVDKAGNLFTSVKQNTADLSMLTNPGTMLALGNLKNLDTSIDYRPEEYHVIRTRTPDWIQALAANLRRVRGFSNGDGNDNLPLDFASLRGTANRLADTSILYVDPLKVIPYIEGEQAGHRYELKAVWHGIYLMVIADGSQSFREIANAVASGFEHPGIQKAVRECIDREGEWIDRYFREYFELGEELEQEGAPAEGEDRDGEEDVPGNELMDPGSSSSPPEAAGGNAGIRNGEGHPDVEVGDTEPEGGSATAATAAKKSRRRGLTPKERFSVFIQQESFDLDPAGNKFLGPEGQMVVQEDGLFPWVRYSTDGEVLMRYRVEEGCLEEGVEVPADVIHLMQNSPEDHCFVLQQKNRCEKYFWQDLEDLLKQRGLRMDPCAFWLQKLGN